MVHHFDAPGCRWASWLKRVPAALRQVLAQNLLRLMVITCGVWGHIVAITVLVLLLHHVLILVVLRHQRRRTLAEMAHVHLALVH